MDIRETMRLFAENNAWANHRLHGAVAELDESAVRATRTSFFPSIHATLSHILLVDLYYLDGMTGGGRGPSIFADEDPYASFEPLRREQRASDARLVDLVCEAGDFDAPVSLQRRDHVQTDRLGMVLLHLFQHQIHHRGQVHATLSGTPVAPPQLDEFFLADELPRREAELRHLDLRIR